MKKETRKQTKRPMTKAKFSKIVITSMLVAVALFTVTMIFLYARFGGVPDTLITYFFMFCGSEAGVMGFIKCSDTKYEKKEKAADGSDNAAVG